MGIQHKTWRMQSAMGRWILIHLTRLWTALFTLAALAPPLFTSLNG